METGNFNRRRFVISSSAASLALMTSNSVFSFEKVFEKATGAFGPGLLFYEDSNGRQKRVTTPAEWEIKRKQILQGMQEAMGKLPDTSGLPAPEMEIAGQQEEDNYTRFTIFITAAAQERVPAYLYVPNQRKGERYPAILAAHPTGAAGKGIVDGQTNLPNRAYARELAQRGYVVIAPDYPSFGDMKNYDFTTDRYQSGTMKNIFDHIRCIDLLQARPDVDPDRIGIIGHSLGGHSAMFTAAFDTRLKVTVSSCGWTLMDYYNAGEAVTKKYGGAMGPWAQERYMPLIRSKYHLDAKKIPFDFDEIIAAIAPRAFFSNSPLHDSNFNVDGVKKGIAQAAEVYRFLAAPDKIAVHYPDAEHDFPVEVRMKAYRFIDKMLGANPRVN